MSQIMNLQYRCKPIPLKLCTAAKFSLIRQLALLSKCKGTVWYKVKFSAFPNQSDISYLTVGMSYDLIVWCSFKSPRRRRDLYGVCVILVTLVIRLPVT